MNHRLFTLRGASGLHRQTGGTAVSPRYSHRRRHVEAFIAKLIHNTIYRQTGKRTRVVLVAAFAGMLLAACGSPVATTVVYRRKGGVSGPPFVRAEEAIFNQAVSFNFFSPNFPFDASNYVLLPLAEPKPPSLASYYPLVARSWRWKGNEFIVRLRDMRWQNGRRLTARDVVDSEILNGVVSGGVWNDITSVRASGTGSVVFTTIRGVSRALAESTILGTYPLPTSQYGKLVTPGLEKTVAAYYRVLLRDPSAASATSPGKEIAADAKKVIDFNPKSLLGDGPFKYMKWSTSELKLAKSETFYRAKNVHIQVFEAVQEGPNISGALLSGLSDFTTSGLPTQVVEKDMALPGHHVAFPLSYVQKGFEFNVRRYPLNITNVRQALVYVLHRPALIPLVYGHLKSYSFTQHPSLLPADELQYISKQQLDSLNPYKYDPEKAASLLESVGFRKTGGHWMLPDGKPFILTMDTDSSYSNSVLVAKIAIDWLNAFGIKTTEVGLTPAADEAALQHGSFDIIVHSIGGSVDPLEDVATGIGTSNNFIAEGEDGIGLGPVMNVPGIGKVNVPVTITKQAAEVGPGKTMDRLVWDWAKFLNQQVPYLSYGNRRHNQMYTTLHYVDWPSETSPLWKLAGIGGGLPLMIEDGYIRPRG